MAITAKQVKELREKTGAGMMDCKKALTECEGDLEKAFDWLREKGIAKAAKKASRIAAEGLSASVVEGNKAAIVEVNSETDFVAKNVEFQEMVKYIATLCVKNEPADLTAALAMEAEPGKTVETYIAEKTGKIGEKLSFRRFVVVSKTDDQAFGAYTHMGGKITALVLVDGANAEKAADVAMQVAAQNPKYIDRSYMPADELAREKEVLYAQAMEENSKAAKPKPAQIIEKMCIGRLNKSLKEICLVDQDFIKDDSMTVGNYIGKNAKVVEMIRYEVGEGMQKREENFAEEVAKQAAK